MRRLIRSPVGRTTQRGRDARPQRRRIPRFERLEQRRLLAIGGSGIFVDSGQFFGGNPPGAGPVAIGDLNGDGNLDALAGTRVWFGDGQGGFADGGQRVPSGNDLELGDLDDDGDLDVFVANGGPNEVWLNDGQGHFTDSGQELGDAASAGVALGDLDGDGDLDALVGNAPYRHTNSPTEFHKVWLNDGEGQFVDSGQNIRGRNVRSVALGDLDGDGDLDAFVGNDSHSHAGGPYTYQVWFNDGQGILTDSEQELSGGPPMDVALGDVDDDGDLDAFVSKVGPQQVWLNEGQGQFDDNGQILGSVHSERLAVGDVDGDGDLDVFIVFAHK